MNFINVKPKMKNGEKNLLAHQSYLWSRKAPAEFEDVSDSFTHSRRNSENEAYYGKLSRKMPMCVDYCY